MTNICENCGKCCLETEMLLSYNDIDLIRKSSIGQIELTDFAIKNNNGYFQLKNFEGKCIFFDNITKKCKIYNFRPQGCRFYPLIYDNTKKKCKLDMDCPKTNQFYKSKKVLEETCRKLKNFLKKQFNMKID